MQWPTLIVDNFFTDPHAVVKLSKTFKYTRDKENNWPGKRTPPLYEVDNNFFMWSTRKIMALLYPAQIVSKQWPPLKWQATQNFQRVPYNTYGKEGWIHADVTHEFTVIIFLSDHPQSGTCLYEGKHFNAQSKYLEEKQRFYGDLKDRSRMEKYRDKTNAQFRKKVEFFSNFNRLVLFDGANWHSSRNADNSKSDRLTLITFFSSVTGEGIRYPITQMRRIE
tara:strand:- start:284 stop:949 length:666 start_codon:yes stop_codon:yes gene_type:complete